MCYLIIGIVVLAIAAYLINNKKGQLKKTWEGTKSDEYER